MINIKRTSTVPKLFDKFNAILVEFPTIFFLTERGALTLRLARSKHKRTSGETLETKSFGRRVAPPTPRRQTRRGPPPQPQRQTRPQNDHVGVGVTAARE